MISSGYSPSSPPPNLYSKVVDIHNQAFFEIIFFCKSNLNDINEGEFSNK